MNGQRTFRDVKGFPFLLALVASVVLSLPRALLADVNNEVPGLVYHAQVTSYYCGSATVEMMLDNATVRANNPYVNFMLTAPDPAPASFFNPITGQDATFGAIPFNAVNNINQSIHPTYGLLVIPGVNNGNPVSVTTYGPQLAIYDLAHGAGTFTPAVGPNAGHTFSYLNLAQPWGAGSGINGQQVELNLFDNANVGGEGIHAYTAYNVASFNVANRTIANAIADYGVPAGGVFYNGAHAMAVTGVRTDVQPVRNQPYNILGFFVDDPWYGYAVNRGLPANQRGLDPHDFVSNVPEGNLPSRWARIFTPSPGEIGEGAYASGAGFKFVVEPQGPEALDDGTFGSSMLPVPPLLTDLDGPGALSAANSLLASDADLSSKYGLSGGMFDGSHLSLLDPLGEDDWLVPYEKSGAYTGAFLISAHYGILEEASWIDAGDSSFNLTDLLGEYQGIEEGFHPNDNPTNAPEPATCVLVAIGMLTFNASYRRRAG